MPLSKCVSTAQTPAFQRAAQTVLASGEKYVSVGRHSSFSADVWNKPCESKCAADGSEMFDILAAAPP